MAEIRPLMLQLEAGQYWLLGARVGLVELLDRDQKNHGTCAWGKHGYTTLEDILGHPI